MSYQKTPDLPGAYYGPSIPPPSYPHSRRRTPCSCCLLDCLCSCLGTCGCCILTCIFQILCSILIFIAFLILVFWLIFRPHELYFTSSSATLTSFNVTSAESTTTLTHDLAVNFTVRNPNSRIGVYYDEIEANEFYGGLRIGRVVYGEKFYQGHKNTTGLGPIVFKGRGQMVKFDGDLKSKFDKEVSDGVYGIVVRLHLKVRFKVGWFKLRDYRMKVKCDLNVPLVGNKSSLKFQETKCHYYI